MIQAIRIDISDVLNEFNIQPSQAETMVDEIVKHVARRFYETWQTTAAQSLKSSRKQYLQNLQLRDEGLMSMSVVLTGKLPLMIEEGCSAFDMKEGFKNSPKAHKNKNGGWYLTIPFRFAGAGSLGESELFSDVLPKEVQKVVSGLSGSKTTEIEVNGEIKGDNNWGGRLSKFAVPEKYSEKLSRPAFSSIENKDINTKSQVAYQHKSSIYEGMVRSEKTYESANQSMFNTFRRVSDNSDPNSWINQGITAYKLAEKAMQNFDKDRELDVAIDNQLAKLF